MSRGRRRETVKTSKLKTMLCTYVDLPEGCQYGENCAFAHSIEELRTETQSASDPVGGQPVTSSPDLLQQKGTDTTEPNGSSAHIPFLSINNRDRVNDLPDISDNFLFSDGNEVGSTPPPLAFSYTVEEPVATGALTPPQEPLARPQRVAKPSVDKGPQPHHGGGVNSAAPPRHVMKVSWNPSNRSGDGQTFQHRTVETSLLHPYGTHNTAVNHSGLHSIVSAPQSSSYVLLTHPLAAYGGGPMMMPGLDSCVPVAPIDPNQHPSQSLYSFHPNVPPNSSNQSAPGDPWASGATLMYSMLPPGMRPIGSLQACTGQPSTAPSLGSSAPVGNEAPVSLDYYPSAYRDWTTRATLVKTSMPMGRSDGLLDIPSSHPMQGESEGCASGSAMQASHVEMSRPINATDSAARVIKHRRQRLACQMLLGKDIEKPKRRLILMNQHQSSCSTHNDATIDSDDVEAFAADFTSTKAECRVGKNRRRDRNACLV